VARFSALAPDATDRLSQRIVPLLVIGLAIYSAATWPASGGAISLFLRFLVFPVAYALNPVDLAWMTQDGHYCPSFDCSNATWIDYAAALVDKKAVAVVWEIAAFFSLLMAVRIAAAKMWPGKAWRS
jgi:hypothetical protein